MKQNQIKKADALKIVKEAPAKQVVAFSPISRQSTKEIVKDIETGTKTASYVSLVLIYHE